MDKTLLELCCKEFNTFDEACKANPYGWGSDVIQYPLPDYTARYRVPGSVGAIGRIVIERLESGKVGWVPQVEEHARLITAVKELIKEETQRAIARLASEFQRASL